MPNAITIMKQNRSKKTSNKPPAPTTEKGWNEVVLEQGAQRLHCPVCGRGLFTPEGGLADQLCEHVLFVNDWIGEFAHVRPSFAGVMKSIEEALDEADEGRRGFRGALLRHLPQTAIILEIVRPACGPDDGDTFVVAFDLDLAQQLEE